METKGTPLRVSVRFPRRVECRMAPKFYHNAPPVQPQFRLWDEHRGDPFGSPDPPHSGGGTSRRAAEKIKTATPTLRQKVLALIKDRGQRGATDMEISLELGLQRDTLRPRRRELVLLRLVCDSGSTRETESGSRAIVWVSCDLVGGRCIDEKR